MNSGKSSNDTDNIPKKESNQEQESAEKPSSLYFHVNDIPDIFSILLFGFQQMMICLSALLVVPYYVSTMVCAGDQAIELRVQLISATFFTSGIATILQTTFGMRLSILHGPSFAFLPALHTFQNNFPCNADTDPEMWKVKMQLISGSCIVAVLLMPLLGLTGLIGAFSRYIGPITIVPIMLLLTIGTVPDIEEKMGLHWISILEFLILILFVVILEEWEVPIPAFSFKRRRFYIARQKILSQFPYLIGISIAWFICFIMTVANWTPVNSPARTDHNDSLHVLETTPWFQIPMPGRYGAPKFNLALVFGFLASCVAAMIESIGDYNLCAKISCQDRPPPSNINRAFVVEGIGCILAALMGVGTGITTYAENIAIMSVTKVASRVTMQVAGLLLITTAVISKFAAFLAMIPEAIIGGVLAIGVCMINGVTLSNLQSVDLRISRNLTIMGVAVIMGCTVPMHFEKHPLRTGITIVDDVFGTLLTIRMLIGGVIAFVLDNVTPGATREQRGFPTEECSDLTPIHHNGYVFSSSVNRFFLKYNWLTHLPVVPSKSEISITEDQRSASSSTSIFKV
ncbi:unnamed protein product [Caenorhabditis bovis]|uniref:Uncharacterized protein n=1 Tax=Caenorhabditis bovis TaxID=2654633 RepID=A0A8S1FC18_9PELO|nr:unnamed protein product [Caenorhabditis bovis]